MIATKASSPRSMRKTLLVLTAIAGCLGQPALANHNPGSQSNQAQGTGLWQTVKDAFWGGYNVFVGSWSSGFNPQGPGSSVGAPNSGGNTNPGKSPTDAHP